jgi:hypothetical protein
VRGKDHEEWNKTPIIQKKHVTDVLGLQYPRVLSAYLGSIDISIIHFARAMFVGSLGKARSA